MIPVGASLPRAQADVTQCWPGRLAPPAYNEDVLRLGLILLLFSGALAGAGADAATVAGFLRKWGICAVAVTALFLAGVVLGTVTRSAMCASVWVCE
jgi:hypothetical protein